LATSLCGVAYEARGGPSLQAARPAQLIVIVSTRYQRNWWRGRDVARKQRHEGRWPSAVHFSASLQCRGANVDGADAACCLPTSREVGYTHAVPFERGAREAKANVEGTRFQKHRALKTGEDRALEGRARASLFVSCRSR
jgi:hypothetical protein